MMPHLNPADRKNDVPWGECASLWRVNSKQRGPGSEEMLAVATLREIVRLAATMNVLALHRLRIVLPDRNCWPYGYFGKQQLRKLIALDEL